MSTNTLHIALLRPPIMHILRAAGFHATRPAVLDTVVDIAARYLTLLATKTAAYALTNHNDLTPTITDVRMALHEIGALWPQISIMEEQIRQEEDMRGVDAFIDWIKGEGNHEIRRIAGLTSEPGEVADMEALEEKGDFLTALKKKHSKTGEESRYQGTVLGIPAEDKSIIIEGGPFESIQAWGAKNRENGQISKPTQIPDTGSAMISSSSSPLSEI